MRGHRCKYPFHELEKCREKDIIDKLDTDIFSSDNVCMRSKIKDVIHANKN